MDTGFQASRTVVAGRTGYAVPLIVSVTGHRNLVVDEVPTIRKHVREFLTELCEKYPDRGVSVMSSLAEGADQIAAEEAITLRIPVIAALPMPRDIYVTDFDSTRARESFDLLLAQSSEIFELPITPGNTRRSIAEYGKNRTRQYAQLGVFLCAHSHILLALWDGKDNAKLGGTASVVRFHHDDVMRGYTRTAETSRLILAEDEGDLVYHIVCSRDQPDGEPAADLEPLSCSWFTSDEDKPRTTEMPQRHKRVFAHTNEFSRDAREHEEAIQSEAWTLIEEDAKAFLPAGVRDIDHVFRVADWLAIHFQKRKIVVLRAAHILAMLMGLMYIAYSDVFPQRIFIIAFIGFFLIAVLINRLGDKGAWHRKYLDYRALAEGLRVQFYWAAAGVTSGSVSKFAHDNFLQMQDSDLGWIRNVMRVAGMECNVKPYTDPRGLDFVIRNWIGDENGGQLGYYRRKGLEKLSRQRFTDRLAAVVLWISFAAFALFAVASNDMADLVRDPLVVFMGVLLLVTGVRQSYVFSIADSELIKQYEFMFRAFRKARRRIDQSGDDEERRRVLKVLGDAALEEHAEWILMHRERASDEGEIWRMTS
ncbi:MAG: hypothetical protein HKN55_06495 [Woeseiaceae bacterium]|nr:hypothetical protein [Woeseiaceae bacterium]